ncbi:MULTISPECIES: 5-oxoprolinase subunit PxpB [Brevibacillus]|uniref:5-oxoprolinase subunit PxpB n=1 Tax=Brevibacillus invocatus TaxID=173959 RepID=A0A3M8BXD4_9BACL|nr:MULTISPECIES: 5-oxoprolinase subunit PxpB [Brevibacillus]MCM3081657.1 5-oxoprolinase subunit PxpB [Brevibacillus invocatus]MCM3431990.1 5-oxoprolinase subunit PxpB [Brevibacillus invocatus]MDH4619414.1 5-oxoprolinase subunit PxpB [Brevibacillus sp. AY1]RNB67697.1 5-oxoprolinase subunit PxpB [Brevibacillus invocatus]
MEATFQPLGDQAVVVQFGTTMSLEAYQQVRQVASMLDRQPIPGMVEYIPAYTTITIFYNPQVVYDWYQSQGTKEREQDADSLYQICCNLIREQLNHAEHQSERADRTIEIPVCYGGELGPDLGDVAELNQLTEQEVIDIHAGGDYLIYMIGFAPGFPYIGGMSERIAAPRRKSPRLSIPSGSVGIAGKQTGIYPMETPGGWQIIGRTPLRLFRPEDDPPSLLQAGDRVRFYPISYDEFLAFEEGSS